MSRADGRGQVLALWWPALGITLAAFALYAYRLGAPSLRGDEAFTAVFSRWELPEILRALRTTEPHPPLYYVLVHLWIKIMGRSELALRLPSFVAGVLTVPLTYALGKRWQGATIGLLGSALVALSPYLIWHAQDARMYSMLAMLGLASNWLAVRMLESGSGRPAGLWLGYVLVTLTALATHYYALFVWVAENLGFAAWWLASRDRRTRSRLWVSAQAAVAICFTPWLLYASGFMLGHSKDWIASIDVFSFVQRLLTTFSVGATFPPRLAWIWVFVTSALLLLGLRASWRSREQNSLASSMMLWAGLAMPIAITFVISLRRPVFDERYLIGCVPLFLLLVARGLTHLRRWQPVAIALLGFLAVGALYSTYQYHHDPQYAKSPDWRDLLEHVTALQEPGDLLILNYPDPSQEYYNSGRLPYDLVPAAYPVDVAAAEEALAQLMDQHPRIWLVPTRANNWDRDGLVEGWLNQRADKVSETGFQGLRLQLYHTPQRFAASMQPMGVRLGESISLLGYDLLIDGQRAGDPPVARPGSALTIKLYWQVLGPVEADYTVFTHLVGPDGALRGQSDGPPMGGAYPTSTWRPEEALVDRYDIAVDPAAPTGRYQVLAGMYLWPSMERLPFADEEGLDLGDALALFDLEIAP